MDTIFFLEKSMCSKTSCSSYFSKSYFVTSLYIEVSCCRIFRSSLNFMDVAQFININGLFVQSWKYSNIQTWSSCAIRCDRNQEFLWQNQGLTGTTEKEGTGIFYTCFNKKLFKSCGSFVILFRWRQLEGWIGSLYQWCF